MKSVSLLFTVVAASALGALPSVGPDYAVPSAPIPSTYRESDTMPWQIASPDDTSSRGEWWKLFGDPALDALETSALAANQDLKAAAARVDQARAAAGLARSEYWPQVALGSSVSRGRTSGTTDNPAPQLETSTKQVSVNASWEIDLFGRVRRLNESARADAEASAAIFESFRLSLSADVAVNYFSLRALDREIVLVDQTTALRRRALELVSARQRNGAAAELDVARAETELATGEAEAAALAERRAAVQNALAILLGVPAPDFALAPNEDVESIPTPVPAGLPATLLERRPDIAAAEHTLAAAHARIGVAKAAFFPAISLTGGAGYASGDLDRLFTADSRIWSIGPSLYLPIFQGGRNRANLARSRAAYEESVAIFRQRVLVAFREVQDALNSTRLLATQSAAQERALVSAHRAARLAQTRYDAGLVTYFEVIDAQRTSLALERANTQLVAQRLNNQVALIKALGGGWHRDSAPLAAR
ncbi:MAG: efflux system, outer rane lipoprotein NodT family [Verrucomicrobia bacterium]|nr:efflux system, outer rane lipoprotein NodT family [Verrucomicrobiota bacterium]